MFKLLLTLLIASPSEITVHRLENGLRIVFVEDKSLPVFCGFIQFDVGSACEAPGLTGVSHLLEHMLFKGTKKLGTTNYKKEAKLNAILENLYITMDTVSDSTLRFALKDSIEKVQNELSKYIISEEIWRIYSMHGGVMMNASTSNTSTQYYVMLPSNKKELWFKVESDRFKNLVLREFFSERNVVNEERRMSESNPYYKLWGSLFATAYIASPIRWPIIGWEDDIMNVKPDQVMWYYKTHYTPDNCIIVLVGDVDIENDLKLAKKYFGDWKGSKTDLFRITGEPAQSEVRRVEIIGPGKPTMGIGFKGPYYPDREYYALELFSYIFGEAEGSIIQRNLVKRGIIFDGGSSLSSWQGKAPSIFLLELHPATGISMNSLEKEIFSLLDSLKTSGIDDASLKKAKNNYRMSFVKRQKEHLYLAFTAASGLRIADDPEYYKKELEIIDSITAEEVKTAISKYLTKNQGTIVTLGGE
ncbi:MAG: pitrilysin family protein [Candidatus Hydrothermia bacterium]|nr:pitrilysin family protein [Candidatus Hydrothermia bacterium]HOL23485.1 pitrilysin family protein [Candidatus Hydrothermia bacterium]HPO78331.1 pitrilysin family protein [Candidatus Hydrothermia bacterium]